ncbi:hypothetical protein B0H19DRAFT_1115624 [Mycena capillaripes]|nr:hypothetical protein B0H19DRAFT_1115624 [Mycena capillaripes]
MGGLCYFFSLLLVLPSAYGREFFLHKYETNYLVFFIPVSVISKIGRIHGHQAHTTTDDRKENSVTIEPGRNKTFSSENIF